MFDKEQKDKIFTFWCKSSDLSLAPTLLTLSSDWWQDVILPVYVVFSAKNSKVQFSHFDASHQIWT
jgi:hypothetical protein